MPINWLYCQDKLAVNFVFRYDSWINYYLELRSTSQINREEMSSIRPGRRRQLMKKEQIRICGVADGVPRWPRTKISEADLRKTAIAVYSKLAGLQAA